MKGINPERGGLVTVTFVAVSMSVMIFRQIFMRVLLEGSLTAGGTKVVHFASVLALELRGFDFDFHLADGINGSGHGFLLLKSRFVHFGRGITVARQRIAVTADGLVAEINQRQWFGRRFMCREIRIG